MSLDSLPTEIMSMILDNLTTPLSCWPLATLIRDQKTLDKWRDTSRNRSVLRGHPYVTLAATSHHFREVVEAHCHRLFTIGFSRGAGYVREPPAAAQSTSKWKAKIHEQRYSKYMCWDDAYDESWDENDAEEAAEEMMEERINTLGGGQTLRWEWLDSVFDICYYCSKRTKRHARFNQSMFCCHKCDMKIFGEAVGTAELRTKYPSLKQIHLDTPREIFPNCPIVEVRRASGMHQRSTKINFSVNYSRFDLDLVLKLVSELDPKGRLARQKLREREKNQTLTLVSGKGEKIEVPVGIAPAEGHRRRTPGLRARTD